MTTVNVIAPYKALPWQEAPWRDKSSIVLLTGSAGGGKSRLWTEKLHGFCKKYPGATAMFLRKTRSSLINSSVLFMERKVIGTDPNVRHLSSKSRFEYSNGSIMAYGGMADEEQREHVRSVGVDGGLDIVALEEATQFEEDDLGEIMPRMRGKAAGWSQILLSTNPDAPTHFINKRLILGGEASVYFSSAADNPFNPPAYREWLDRLVGVQRLRLRDGKWIQAEGAIYPNFDPAYNITKEADYQEGRTLLWGCDDGYAEGKGPGTISYHPRVILVGQVNEWGGLDIFGEYYETGVSDYQESIASVRAMGYPDPDLALLFASSAQFRGALSKAGIRTLGTKMSVVEGIKHCRQMICDGKEQRLARFHPRCVQFNGEMQSYSYNPRGMAAKDGERTPLKMEDHGPDAFRAMAEYLAKRGR